MPTTAPAFARRAARRTARPARAEVLGAVWIVLPTYNEAENLERVVERILDELRTAAPFGHRVLIVDDGSPDGTGAIADRLAAEHEAVTVLHRTEKAGLAQAYLAGFGLALRLGARLVVQMDADLSHDPAALPALIDAAADADVVLGSRYVEGGRTEWSATRRAISRCGSWYARTVLGLEARDLTGGFKCWRREALEAVRLDQVTSVGYAFQIEMTYRAATRGLRVAEVPITFRDRTMGESKMSPAIALEAVWRVPGLRRTARPPKWLAAKHARLTLAGAR